MANRPKAFPDFVHFDGVKSVEEYEALPDKYSYDVLLVLLGGVFI